MSDEPKVGTVVINGAGIWMLVRESESDRVTLLDLSTAMVYPASHWNNVKFPAHYIDEYSNGRAFLIQDVAVRLAEIMNET